MQECVLNRLHSYITFQVIPNPKSSVCLLCIPKLCDVLVRTEDAFVKGTYWAIGAIKKKCATPFNPITHVFHTSPSNMETGGVSRFARENAEGFYLRIPPPLRGNALLGATPGVASPIFGTPEFGGSVSGCQFFFGDLELWDSILGMRIWGFCPATGCPQNPKRSQVTLLSHRHQAMTYVVNQDLQRLYLLCGRVITPSVLPGLLSLQWPQRCDWVCARYQWSCSPLDHWTAHDFGCI